MIEEIKHYFPSLTTHQYQQLSCLEGLYCNWNSKINVISRKDIDHLWVHHILHSLSIARIISFKPGTRVMDAGTGGGFPGIPLAILFPEAEFTLVDSVEKKIKVVREISQALEIPNVIPIRCRFEEIHDHFDFITGRAVMALQDIYRMVRDKIKANGRNTIPNGILYLKGGDFEPELDQLKCKYTIYEIYESIPEPFFLTKRLVHLYG
ncbi:MAG: 16S rRNA (guanine(527)-N(7))-methyltransferase RsmG [Bacteroidetes bacterium]|nr:16S rRNA (guanine(527)-N(7))-methyltransferase RsmG [Bacteroidota bacterium]